MNLILTRHLPMYIIIDKNGFATVEEIEEETGVFRIVVIAPCSQTASNQPFCRVKGS